MISKFWMLKPCGGYARKSVPPLVPLCLYCAQNAAGEVCDRVFPGIHLQKPLVRCVLVAHSFHAKMQVNTGICIPFFFTARYVRWRKLASGRDVNKVMVFTMVFYGLAITLVCTIHHFYFEFSHRGCQHWALIFVHVLPGFLRFSPEGEVELFSKTTVIQIEVLIGDWIVASTTTFARSLDCNLSSTGLGEEPGHLPRSFFWLVRIHLSS